MKCDQLPCPRTDCNRIIVACHCAIVNVLFREFTFAKKTKMTVDDDRK